MGELRDGGRRVGDESRSGPFTIPDTFPGGLLATLLALLLIVAACVVVIGEWRRRATTGSWWRVGVAFGCAVGAIAMWYAVFQPVTFVRNGVRLECAYGDPTFDIARLQGVPDDSVLSADQMHCRSHAQKLLLIEGSVAALVAVVIAGTGLVMWRSRRTAVP